MTCTVINTQLRLTMWLNMRFAATLRVYIYYDTAVVTLALCYDVVF